MAPLPFLRGVNLGSLFIPERWMVPSVFAGSEASSLCDLTRRNASLAASRLSHHLRTFVTADDIAYLADRGINAVRVPLGWWNAVDASHLPSPPFLPSPSVSLAVLDSIFAWCERHGIRVLLDLHGAPGSQNGADHSGCDTEGVRWGEPHTVQLSLAAISALISRYASHPMLLGIELMNEPGWAVEWDHGKLLRYYTEARAIVRAASPSSLVVFNVLYNSDFPAGFGNWWDGQLTGPDVVLDLHFYDCFANNSAKSLAEHIATAAGWRDRILRMQAGGHQVMVGEWSLAMGAARGGQQWADAQLDAFSVGMGWFFWNFKMEEYTPGDQGGDTWSLLGALQSGIVGISAERRVDLLKSDWMNHSHSFTTKTWSGGSVLFAALGLLLVGVSVFTGRRRWLQRSRHFEGLSDQGRNYQRMCDESTCKSECSASPI